MTIYPPVINSSIPAFSYDEKFKFYFDFPYTIGTTSNPNYDIDIKIANAQTNKTIYHEQLDYERENNDFYITVPAKHNMQQGNIYKIQIRLIGQGLNSGKYSEWSTVCYAKATASKEDITLSILNLNEDGNVQFIESPTFMGQFSNADETEPESYYCFTLFNEMEEIVETTGWLAHIDSIDSVTFSKSLIDFSKYYLEYQIKTKNNLIVSTSYDFICSFSLLGTPQIKIEGNNNFEEGCIELHLTSADKLSTNIILRRTDSRSNYQIWEDYKIFNILDSEMDIIFKDLIIENGIKYQYGIQTLQSNKFRGDLIKSQPILAEYEYAYLVGQDQQLKIKFNSTMNSLKRTIQETKTDTIGSRYPFITRGGNVNYFTFPVNGLISYHLDEAEMFCKKSELMISDAYEFNAHTNLTNDNIVFEREFRNKVEEFLTNGEYKYYKSPTEGVFLIALTAVSLAPEKTLGRMIYSFTGTAYEIDDVSLTSVISYGLISSGVYQEVDQMGMKEISNVLSLRTERDQNIFSIIADKIYQNNNTYERFLHHLNYLSIEIANLQSVPSTGYLTYIKNKNGDAIKIVISKELGYYELNNVFDIYDFIVSQPGIDMTIKYTAVCQYKAKAVSLPNFSDYQAVSNFYQLYTTFDKNQDIIASITSEEGLIKIVNLTYLRVDGLPGTQIEINEKIYMLDDSGSVEIKDQKITSAKMISSGVASVSVIYNGFTKA